MVVLGCVEVLYGYLYLSILRLNRLRLITHFDFADVPQKGSMNKDEEALIKLDSTVILLLHDRHGHYTLADSH